MTARAKDLTQGKNEDKNGHCDGDSKKLSHRARLRHVRYSLKNDNGQNLETKGVTRCCNGLRSGQSWQQCFAEKAGQSVTQKTENDKLKHRGCHHQFHRQLKSVAAAGQPLPAPLPFPLPFPFPLPRPLGRKSAPPGKEWRQLVFLLSSTSKRSCHAIRGWPTSLDFLLNSRSQDHPNSSTSNPPALGVVLTAD